VPTNEQGSGATPHAQAAALAGIRFRDPEQAGSNLARITSRVPAGVRSAIAPLLADSPDPDTALNLFERLTASASDHILRLLDKHKFLVHYALVVFGYSRFLGETLIQNTDLLPAFLREKNLDRSFSIEDFREALARFRSRSFETDVALLLARFRRREYVRIMLRDVLNIAPLAETTAELSALADVLIEETLREADNELRVRYGPPQHIDSEGRLVDTPFAVLSLGKLGGNELNYSSDIDLLYIFGDGEEIPGAAISNQEYFVRLAQRITEVLSKMTREGAVFRIDLRLRPQGGEGELAIALQRALRYYARVAHDWEKQAMIKVRYSAGDSRLAREFIRGVQPHVYTEHLNFPAVETALRSRERMRRHRGAATQRLSRGADVKLDHGGIRDIEFLVQCLQRVYGGAEQWLRSGGTMFSLQKLHDKRHISGKDFHELTTSYEFLRRVEHRLQLREGQQTHSLPQDAYELAVLSRAVGQSPQGGPSDIADAVSERMKAVSEIYKRVIHRQQLQHRFDTGEQAFELRTRTDAIGEQSYRETLERLAADAPVLYEIAAQPDLGPQTRRNLHRFFSAAFTSSERFAAVVRHPQAVSRALKIFATSDYLTDILIHHPEEVAVLETIGDTRLPGGMRELFDAISWQRFSGTDPIFSYLAEAPADYSEKLALLRKHYRHRVFTTGARDITELRPVYQSLAASTAAAEDAIGAALAIAGQLDGFAVMALGRLGTSEFDLLSDADLLFVRDETLDPERANRAAELMMEALSAYTREGAVFPVDARLRPRGAEGELVITPGQMSSYFEQEAQAWEALTYTKLRFLAGSHEIGELAMKAAGALFGRFAHDTSFLPAIREMRTRLEASEPTENNFKTAPGAVYDVDFIACYLLATHELEEKGGNLRARLWRLAGLGLLDKTDAAALDHAAELMRTIEHVVRLVGGKARKSPPATEHARRVAAKLTSDILCRDFPDGLEAELNRTKQAVREVYNRILR